MTWVWDFSKAKGNDRLVLLAIADAADHDGSNAWPSVATLARKCGISESTVHRCIGRLIELGELAVDRQQGGPARMRRAARPNAYTVLMRQPGVSGYPQGAVDNSEGCQSDRGVGCQSDTGGVSICDPAPCQSDTQPVLTRPRTARGSRAPGRRARARGEVAGQLPFDGMLVGVASVHEFTADSGGKTCTECRLPAGNQRHIRAS